MTAPLSAGRTARLLLRYRRDPSRYHGEACRADAPTLDFDVVLRLAQGREVAFGQTSLEDASPDALTDAAKGYLQNVCFRPDATPYQTLGLEPDATAESIKERFRLLMQLVHPDRHGTGASWPPECAAQASRAYTLLRSSESRAKFDREERERVERERASKQAAVAAAAAMPGTRDLPRAVRHPRRPLPQPVLPEWWTAGVGGFVRAHPAGVAFGALVAASAVVAGFALWESDAASLTRGRTAAPGADVPPAVAAVVALAKRDQTRSSLAVDEPREPASVSANAPSVAAAPAATAPVRVRAQSEHKSETPDRSPAPNVHAPASVSAAAATSVTAPATSTVAVAPTSIAPRAAPAAPPVADAPPPAAAAPPVRSSVAAPVPPAAAVPSAVAAAVPSTIAIVPPGVAPPPPAIASPPPAPMPLAVASGVDTPAARPMPAVAAPPPATLAEASLRAPANAEIELLFAAFVDAYDRGRADAFALLFDADARANQHQGRAAIRGEYDDLFRRSQWRRMQVIRMNWRRVGDTAQAKGEIAVRTGLRDGREHEERLSVDMELVRRDGRLVITRLDQRPGAP